MTSIDKLIIDETYLRNLSAEPAMDLYHDLERLTENGKVELRKPSYEFSSLYADVVAKVCKVAREKLFSVRAMKKDGTVDEYTAAKIRADLGHGHYDGNNQNGYKFRAA